jgi:hypothetical protein
MVCRSIDNEGAYDFIKVKGERVDSVVQEDVLLMKLDVEGFEPTAFQSSKGILDSYKCASGHGVAESYNGPFNSVRLMLYVMLGWHEGAILWLQG